MKIGRSTAYFLVLATTFLASCGTTERDWKAAKEANTASAYADFLAKHPQGSHVDEARAAIDDLDWNSAKIKNTSVDYNKYLLAYPAGQDTSEARAAIEDLSYVPLNLPCGALVKSMASTFFGPASGELGGFECMDKDKKIVEIKLKSNKFSDGKIETEDFGVIVMKSNGMLSAAYEILAGQRKKLQALLGYDANAAPSSGHPDGSAKN